MEPPRPRLSKDAFGDIFLMARQARAPAVWKIPGPARTLLRGPSHKECVVGAPILVRGSPSPDPDARRSESERAIGATCARLPSQAATARSTSGHVIPSQPDRFPFPQRYREVPGEPRRSSRRLRNRATRDNPQESARAVALLRFHTQQDRTARYEPEPDAPQTSAPTKGRTSRPSSTGSEKSTATITFFT